MTHQNNQAHNHVSNFIYLMCVLSFQADTESPVQTTQTAIDRLIQDIAELKKASDNKVNTWVINDILIVPSPYVVH